MMSLFSSFDSSLFSLGVFITGMLFSNFFLKLNKLSYFSVASLKLFKGLESFFITLKIDFFNKNFAVIFLSVFIMLLVLNFSSVLSFNFASTSQVSMVLFLGFSSWLGYNIFFNINCWKGFLSHCIPEGTPIYLVWFLFLIELISTVIRPITITVRLVANILAGHLLMILLSQLVFIFPLVSGFYFVLNMVEFVVALIQAYIFTTMLVLYYSDVK